MTNRISPNTATNRTDNTIERRIVGQGIITNWHEKRPRKIAGVTMNDMTAAKAEPWSTEPLMVRLSATTLPNGILNPRVARLAKLFLECSKLSVSASRAATQI